MLTVKDEGGRWDFILNTIWRNIITLQQMRKRVQQENSISYIVNKKDNIK
jgi:hypothetical protein